VVIVYGLVDPRTDTLRYIGQSKDPRKRYWRHCHPAKNSYTHRDNWIRAILRQGLTPEFIELDSAATQEDADLLECFWIASLRAAGALLLNREDGGKTTRGRLGQNLTAEQRAKISEAHKGVKHSAETRMKMSQQRKGRKISEETRARISVTQMARHRAWKMPLETRLTIAEKVRESWKVRRQQTPISYTRKYHPLKITHGTTTGYQYGCRCGTCTEAHRVIEKKRRDRLRRAV
jgi:predicted GIY-YIG superfamily endonuclease